MWYFAILVFALHALAELAFGLRAFAAGAFSSQGAEEVAAQPPHLAGAARFLGSALVALGVLGAAVIVGPGVSSPIGTMVAAILALFHGMGVAGVIVTARAHPGYLSKTHARGAMLVHLVLALGFLVVVVT